MPTSTYLGPIEGRTIHRIHQMSGQRSTLYSRTGVPAPEQHLPGQCRPLRLATVLKRLTEACSKTNSSKQPPHQRRTVYRCCGGNSEITLSCVADSILLVKHNRKPEISGQREHLLIEQSGDRPGKTRLIRTVRHAIA